MSVVPAELTDDSGPWRHTAFDRLCHEIVRQVRADIHPERYATDEPGRCAARDAAVGALVQLAKEHHAEADEAVAETGEAGDDLRLRFQIIGAMAWGVVWLLRGQDMLAQSKREIAERLGCDETAAGYFCGVAMTALTHPTLDGPVSKLIFDPAFVASIQTEH